MVSVRTNGPKVRELREKLGLTQKQLAAQADLSLRTIAKVEAGRENEPVEVADTLVPLAKALLVPTHLLVHPDHWPRLPDIWRPPAATGPAPPPAAASLSGESRPAAPEPSPPPAGEAKAEPAVPSSSAGRREPGYRTRRVAACLVVLGVAAAILAVWLGRRPNEAAARHDAAGHFAKGMSYYDARLWEPAIGEFTLAIKEDPSNADAHHMKGLCFAFWNERFADALPCYDEAIRLNPKLYGAYTNRGWARRKLGDYEGALADCEVVISGIQPPPPAHARSEAFRNRGDVFRDMCGPDTACTWKAIAAYREALTLDPQNGTARRGLIELYERVGRHADAETTRTGRLPEGAAELIRDPAPASRVPSPAGTSPPGSGR